MDYIEISAAVYGIVKIAIQRGLLPLEDRTWAANAILDVLGLNRLEPTSLPEELPLEDLLIMLLDDAVDRGVISDSIVQRDLLDTAIAGCLTPPPSAVIRDFARLYNKSPKSATDWFYRFCKDCNYIREYRIKKDVKWKYPSKYGDMDITINLAKPEKDPHYIALAAGAGNTVYPACQLCRENEGYAGRCDHPARQNLRLIPIDILGEKWEFQYSPYVYYNEHCIVLNDMHKPMIIDAACFRKLFSFLDQFPHYFIGSNADLPIVGGSILSHEHFQGGCHVFPIEGAALIERLPFSSFEGVEGGLLSWPLTTIRLQGVDSERICRAADQILMVWRDYNDMEAGIISKTDGVPHNTVTPIARRRGSLYELDIVLRNNRATPEYPLGLFHPHQELHHIKKENIGLIEVMGLAILPPHLKPTLEALGKAMVSGGELRTPEFSRHAEWAKDILSRREIMAQNVENVLREEVGAVFVKCLEHAGVFGQGQSALKYYRRFCRHIAASHSGRLNVEYGRI